MGTTKIHFKVKIPAKSGNPSADHMLPKAPEHTFKYSWKRAKRSRVATPAQMPEKTSGGDSKDASITDEGAWPVAIDGNFVRGVEFGVQLGERLVFTSDCPFTMFFRYGRPDKGDIGSTDEQKQIHSKNFNGLHEASVRASLAGLYAPVIVSHCIKEERSVFIYDRGLSFEVHPSGS